MNLVVVLWVPGGPIPKSWIFTLLGVTLTNLNLVKTEREGMTNVYSSVSALT